LFRTLSDAACGLPPLSAERLVFPEAISLTSFPEAEPQENVIKENSAESHRHSPLCGGKPQSLLPTAFHTL